MTSLLRRFLDYLKKLLRRKTGGTIVAGTLTRGRYCSIVRMNSQDKAIVALWRCVLVEPPNPQIWITCYDLTQLNHQFNDNTHRILIVMKWTNRSKRLLEKDYNLRFLSRGLKYRDASEQTTEMIARSLLHEFKSTEIDWERLCDYYTWIATVSKLENTGSDWYNRSDIEAQVRKRKIRKGGVG